MLYIWTFISLLSQSVCFFFYSTNTPLWFYPRAFALTLFSQICLFNLSIADDSSFMSQFKCYLLRRIFLTIHLKWEVKSEKWKLILFPHYPIPVALYPLGCFLLLPNINCSLKLSCFFRYETVNSSYSTTLQWKFSEVHHHNIFSTCNNGWYIAGAQKLCQMNEQTKLNK